MAARALSKELTHFAGCYPGRLFACCLNESSFCAEYYLARLLACYLEEFNSFC